MSDIKNRESTSSTEPVFVDDPTITRINTKNYIKSAPNINYNTNSYSETQIIIKDYSSEDEKFDKNFRKSNDFEVFFKKLNKNNIKFLKTQNI